jgi:phage virion morphogenesis protein
MTGVTLRVAVEYDDQQVKEALARLVALGSNMKPVFADIGEYLDLAHRERWDAQEAPDGSPWEPLKEATLKRKQRKGRSSDILVETAVMRDTLRYLATPDELRFGTDRIQGATHQFGREEDGIPAREWLGLSDADKEEVLAILEDHIQDALTG